MRNASQEAKTAKVGVDNQQLSDRSWIGSYGWEISFLEYSLDMCTGLKFGPFGTKTNFKPIQHQNWLIWDKIGNGLVRQN